VGLNETDLLARVEARDADPRHPAEPLDVHRLAHRGEVTALLLDVVADDREEGSPADLRRRLDLDRDPVVKADVEDPQARLRDPERFSVLGKRHLDLQGGLRELRDVRSPPEVLRFDRLVGHAERAGLQVVLDVPHRRDDLRRPFVRREERAVRLHGFRPLLLKDEFVALGEIGRRVAGGERRGQHRQEEDCRQLQSLAHVIPPSPSDRRAIIGLMTRAWPAAIVVLFVAAFAALRPSSLPLPPSKPMPDEVRGFPDTILRSVEEEVYLPIAGWVVDEVGRPVEGASVSIFREGDEDESVRTDADGAYLRFPGSMEAGTFIHVRHPRFAPTRAEVIDVDPRGAAIRVRSGVPLRGVVRDGEDGSAVPGARVTVTAPKLIPQETRTDAEGRFEIASLPEHEIFRIRADAGDRGVAVIERTRPARTARLTLFLQPDTERDTVRLDFPVGAGVAKPKTAVIGRIVDENGTPIIGAEVTLTQDFGWWEDGWWRSARAGEDGRFFIPVAEAGHAALTRSAPGFEEIIQRVTVGPEETDLGDLGTTSLPLREGRVVTEAGAPVPTATVRVGHGGLDRPVSPEGRFRVHVTRSDGRNLIVTAPGRIREMPTIGDLPATGEWVVVLRPVHSISGVVLDREGRPIPGAELDTCSSERGDRVTDIAGGFRLEYGRPGTKRFTVRASGHHFRGYEAETGREGLVVRAGRATVIGGRVLDDRDRPVPNADVKLDANGAYGAVHTATDEDGRFRFEGVLDGECRVAVTPEDPALAVHPVTIDAADARGLVIRAIRTLTLSGRILHGDGRAAGDAEVAAWPEEEGIRYVSGEVAEDGTFVIRGLLPGTWHVVASFTDADARPWDARAHRVKAGAAELSLVLKLWKEPEGK
jgi:protocatechuate 3,4-dioxygenase beta subunit